MNLIKHNLFEMQKAANRQEHMGAAGMGLFILIIIISKYAATGSLLYRFEVGVAYPAIFVLTGYNMRFPKNKKELLKKTIKEFLILIVPSYISYFALQLYTYANTNWGSIAYWNVYMNYMKSTFYYSSAREYGDIPSIGPVWLLISLFITRLVINIISTIICEIYRTKHVKFRIGCNDVAILLCLAIGIIGSTLIFTYTILPLNLSIDFLAILLSSVGMAWKRIYQKRNNKVYYTSVMLMAIVGIIAIFNNKLIDMVGLEFSGYYLAVLLSLCCIIPICHAANYFSKCSAINDIFSLQAKYGIIIIISYEFDAIFSVIWNIDNPTLSAIARVAMVYAISGMVIQTWNLITSDKRQESINDAIRLKYHKAITVIFYITIAILYLTAAMPYGAIYYIIPEETSRTFEKVPIAILIIIFSYAVTCYKSKKNASFMTVIVWLAFVQTIIRQNQDSVLGFVLLAGASILSSQYLVGRVIMGVELAFVLTMYTLSINGYIPYRIVNATSVLTGHSFGTIGKNELAAFFLIIGITCCISHKHKNKYTVMLDTAFIGLLAFINYRYVGGRSDFALTVLLLLGNIAYQIFGKTIAKFNIVENISKWLHYLIGIPIYLIVMFSYIAMASTYDGTNIPFGNIISKFTDATTYGYRLWLSKTAMMVYHPKFWGQYIFETLSPSEGAGYFWIDNSYVRMLLMYGIAATSSAIIILTLYQYIYAKNKRYFMVFIGIIIALMGIMGHRVPLYLFNPIPALLFADNNTLKKNKKVN